MENIYQYPMENIYNYMSLTVRCVAYNNIFLYQYIHTIDTPPYCVKLYVQVHLI